MTDLWQTLQHLGQAYQGFWVWVGALSLLFFIGSILALPWLVSQIPQNYFQRARRPFFSQSFTPVRIVAIVAKTVIGVVLIMLGVLMLFLPGQGLLTILAGVLLADFPGKFRLEKWLVSQRGVIDGINWLRAKRRIPPLLPPEL